MLKKVFVEKIEERIKENPTIKILDLGCGDASNLIWLLKKYPELTYLGIEPGQAASEKARKNLSKFKNAKIINSSAYETSKEYRDFDLVYSLSVLEHVKDIDRFLKNSVDSLKSGGELIHRYDLGHVLYPSSSKEWLQGILSKYFTRLLPESKVIRHIDIDWLRGALEGYGLRIDNISYHQMPNHKEFLKKFKTKTEEAEKLARDIVDWEYKVSPYLGEMEQIDKEKLFPSVCVWAKKK